MNSANQRQVNNGNPLPLLTRLNNYDKKIAEHEQNIAKLQQAKREELQQECKQLAMNIHHTLAALPDDDIVLSAPNLSQGNLTLPAVPVFRANHPQLIPQQTTALVNSTLPQLTLGHQSRESSANTSITSSHSPSASADIQAPRHYMFGMSGQRFPFFSSSLSSQLSQPSLPILIKNIASHQPVPTQIAPLQFFPLQIAPMGQSSNVSSLNAGSLRLPPLPNHSLPGNSI